MGSSREANGQNIDTTVGGLVWVRRRNGSWWPGQILAADELPEGLVVFPKRTGTPVKLLGREDASVDWYNLEKSKRVKAFRCGEYDNCIEIAKVTANISCKKVARYARREDAILHALEIESSHLSKYNNSDTIPQTEETGNTSHRLSGVDFSSVSPQELPRPAASADISLDGVKLKQQTSNDSEDDGTEGSKKRMRGLHDLGVGRAVSSFKKKRTRVANGHDFLKRKNRRCQLTKVLKKTEMVTVPVMCDELTGLNESGFPEARVLGMEYNEFKGRFSDSTGDSSGRLFDVPFVREEKQTAGSLRALAPETGQVGSTLPQSGQSSFVETISVGPDEFQESGSIISGADISHIIDINGSSKWRHKGKRKSRNKSKTRTMRSFLIQDDESKKVNNTVKVTVPQGSKFIHKALDLAYKRTVAGSLYDVNIDVKMGNFPQHLAYTSLLSRFTGQHVTGHSLEVEVFNDDVSDLSFNSSECLSSSCELGRVNMVKGDVELVPDASKKARKNGHLSNKKIRMLSSLTGSKIPSEKVMLKRPDLACVPLKIVFGRIHAALGISNSADGSLTR